MKNHSELHDEFSSSAGVPTIPLNTAKQRSFSDVVVYVIVACIIVGFMLIDSAMVYSALLATIALYFGVSFIASALVVILGIIIKNKWVLLIGLLSGMLGVGLVLSEQSMGVSVAISLLITFIIYRWYTSRYYITAERWPILLGALALLFGLLLIIMQLRIITGIVIAPVLLLATGAMIVWELWRTIRR
jgi:hypothetical protein